jgi:hypothetical protein
MSGIERKVERRGRATFQCSPWMRLGMLTKRKTIWRLTGWCLRNGDGNYFCFCILVIFSKTLFLLDYANDINIAYFDLPF